MRKRRSVRNYSSQPLSKQEVSQLLFAAGGKTGIIQGTVLRTAPSAGALYPIEIYVVVNNVKKLEKGIYHYNTYSHALEQIKKGNFRRKITKATLEQEMAGESAITIILTSIFDRVCHKYGDRGYRYAYIEAGHISQNVYLQATSLKLCSVSIGAFIDDDVNSLIGVDGKKESAVYLHAIGRSK